MFPQNGSCLVKSHEQEILVALALPGPRLSHVNVRVVADAMVVE